MWVGALDKKRIVWFSLQLWSTRSWLLIMNHLTGIAESSPSADPITQLGMGTSKWPGSKKSCGSHPRCNVIIILARSSLPFPTYNLVLTNPSSVEKSEQILYYCPLQWRDGSLKAWTNWTWADMIFLWHSCTRWPSPPICQCHPFAGKNK